MKRRFQALALVAIAPMALPACSKVQAKSAMKDGNKEYKEENFKLAIEHYTRAVEKQPNYAEAWFYLGSSNQALYRPGKDTPVNKAYLEKAIEAYKKSLENNQADSPNLRKVRVNTLGALTGIYSEEPFKDCPTAEGFANTLVADSPEDPKNLYALANLQEKCNKIAEAEATYKKVEANTLALYRQLVPEGQPAAEPPASAEASPSPSFVALENAWKACGALAAYYNKPLWDETGAVWQESSGRARRSRFDQAIEILQKCSQLKPQEAEGYQKIATFFWDKAYRDPTLNDEQKEAYADKGLQAVDKALELKPEYFEAMIYKGLLYRVKATVAKNPRLRDEYLQEAQNQQKRALELKKQMDAQAAAAAANAAPLAPQSPGGGN
jgi:tetratricopeptide (TPR) repeat protein